MGIDNLSCDRCKRVIDTEAETWYCEPDSESCELYLCSECNDDDNSTRCDDCNLVISELTERTMTADGENYCDPCDPT